jgi:hypothetical protein
LLNDERSRRAVEVAERYADGQATQAELDAARAAAEGTADDNDAARAAWRTTGEAWDAARVAARDAARGLAGGVPYGPAWDNARDAAGASQCDILRDLFGNPFRPVTLGPAWRTPTLLALAEASYEHRLLPSGHFDPQRLAILADALLDAGCEDTEISGHLRHAGPHVRGCAVVDLILGKS